MEYNNMNASEALYGFGAWLTTRKEVLNIGASHDASIVTELIKKFIDANRLEDVRDWRYPKNITHPKED